MKKTKNNFWIWSPYSTVRGMAFVTEISGLSDEQIRKIHRGEKISPLPKISVRDYSSGRFHDQLGAYIGVMLVSTTLRNTLENMPGVNLQFIPARINGQPDLEYWVVNILDVIPAIDLERSKYENFDGSVEIRKIDNLVLRKIPDTAPPIFHVAEDVSLIMINDDLRLKLDTASKHPGVLTPAENYRNEF